MSFDTPFLALLTNEKDFIKVLNEEKTKFKPFGKKIDFFTRDIPIIEP